MANKPLFWTITILLFVVAAFVLTTTVILPVTTKNPLPEAVSSKSEVKVDSNAKKTDKATGTPKKNEKAAKNGKNSEVKVAESQPAEEAASAGKEDLLKYYETKKNELVLRSLYNLSAEDSAYLMLDLTTKVATLEMKGVPLHDTPLKEVWISNAIKMSPIAELTRWLSQPFVLKNVVSTIERVQFLVKNAPKDTIEANKVDAIPVPRRTEDVFIVLNFDRNLQLVIQQSEISEGADKARIDSMKTNFFKKETEKSIKALTTLKRDAITPKIVLTLPKTEAITLYRALPQKFKMVIKL